MLSDGLRSSLELLAKFPLRRATITEGFPIDEDSWRKQHAVRER